jgi:hypothetical protein
MFARHLLAAIPSLVALSGPLISGHTGPNPIRGLPTLLVCTAGWGVFGTRAYLAVAASLQPGHANGRQRRGIQDASGNHPNRSGKGQATAND